MEFFDCTLPKIYRKYLIKYNLKNEYNDVNENDLKNEFNDIDFYNTTISDIDINENNKNINNNYKVYIKNILIDNSGKKKNLMIRKKLLSLSNLYSNKKGKLDELSKIFFFLRKQKISKKLNKFLYKKYININKNLVKKQVNKNKIINNYLDIYSINFLTNYKRDIRILEKKLKKRKKYYYKKRLIFEHNKRKTYFFYSKLYNLYFY